METILQKKWKKIMKKLNNKGVLTFPDKKI